MEYFARQKRTFFTFLTCTVLGLSAHCNINLFNQNVAPTQLATWKHTPDVRVCTYAPVTAQEIKEGINWWTSRGYTFGRLYLDDCQRENIYGAITIGIPTQNRVGTAIQEGALGTTLIYSYDKESIDYVRIEFMNHPDDKVIAHELGHALGWLHTKQMGHIMYPHIQFVGWDDFGIIK
jgi:hypothetical protein